jgi:hypothetical protein
MRSGTTLVSRILNNHSELSVTYDSVHFMRFCFLKFNPIQRRENYIRLLENIKTRVENRMSCRFDVLPLIRTLDRLTAVDYATIYDEVMRALLLIGGAHRWGEKTMMCWTKIPGFLEMFPCGKTIHVVRDPRDAVASLRKITTEPGLRYLDCIFAMAHAMSWGLEEGRRFAPDRYRIIRYEDLVQRSRKTVEDLCAFLEIPVEETMLDHRRFVDRGGSPWRGNSSYREKNAGIDDASVGKFREELSPEEVFLAEMICRKEMKAFDYPLTGTWLNRRQWDRLYDVLSDDFIQGRFRNWLKTNQGIEGYPSDPPPV